jgi:hypothetical protein
MTVARARLLIAAVLFFGWLGWLAYLALTQTNPVVVSHSQVMAADRFVVGEVSLDPSTGALGKTVAVVEDLKPDGAPLGGTIEVRNLEEAEVAGGDDRFRDKGHYLLMLKPIGENKFDLARPPGRSAHAPGGGRPWVYPWDNPVVRRQFEELVSKK